MVLTRSCGRAGSSRLGEARPDEAAELGAGEGLLGSGGGSLGCVLGLESALQDIQVKEGNEKEHHDRNRSRAPAQWSRLETSPVT